MMSKRTSRVIPDSTVILIFLMSISKTLLRFLVSMASPLVTAQADQECNFPTALISLIFFYFLVLMISIISYFDEGKTTFSGLHF